MIKLGSTVRRNPFDWPYDDQDHDCAGVPCHGVVIKIYNEDQWVRVAWVSGKADNYMPHQLVEVESKFLVSKTTVKEFEEV